MKKQQRHLQKVEKALDLEIKEKNLKKKIKEKLV
jgi:hypothetical protein